MSPYYPNDSGQMIADLPHFCPFCFADANIQNHPCDIVYDHDRERKTGPCFPLHVLRCKTHKVGFTVYPPGHVPYGRQIIAPVEPDNSKTGIKREDSFFSGTYFDAALDVNSHNVWAKESMLNSLSPRYVTQTRHLKRAGLLLGVDADLEATFREIISQTLNIPGQLIFENASAIKDDPGYYSQGKAICNILDALSDQTAPFERLATAGYLTGLWPEPSFWDVRHQVLRPTPFHPYRTRAAPF